MFNWWSEIPLGSSICHCSCFPAVMGSSSIVSSPLVVRSPVVEEPSQFNASSTNSSDHPPPPPTILAAPLEAPSHPSTSPARRPRSPDRVLTTHILTHLIEGFIIREGLKPFPVISVSILILKLFQLSFPRAKRSGPNRTPERSSQFYF